MSITIDRCCNMCGTRPPSKYFPIIHCCNLKRLFEFHIVAQNVLQKDEASRCSRVDVKWISELIAWKNRLVDDHCVDRTG